MYDTGDPWDTCVGLPFWTNVTVPGGCTLQTFGTVFDVISFPLCTGLNLVSLPVYSTSITKASHMLADIPSSTGVFRWRRELSCLDPATFDAYFDISHPSEDFALMPGRGYYISVASDSTWLPPNP